MTLYQKMLIFYGVMGFICAVISWFLTKESRWIRLLAALLNNPGKVLTQRQLLNQVWGPNAVEHSHYLRIYMGHLRQKLEADPARPQHLLTETGIGYRFMP